MEKGLTPVIAVVLLLLITISIGGFGFLFFGRTAETSAKAGEEELKQLVSQSGGMPRIENVDENRVYIRNAGSGLLANPSFYVEGKKLDASGPSSIEPGSVGEYVLEESQLAGLPKIAEVKVTTSGFSDSVVAAVRELLAAIIPSGTIVTTGMVIDGEEDGILFRNSAGDNIAVITDAGKVGIGTTTPGALLDVYKTSGSVARFGQTGDALSVDAWGSLTDSTSEVYINDQLRVVNDAWLATASGNVGIGTTAPGAKLEISGGNVKIATAQNKLIFDNDLRYIQGTRSGADYLTISEHSYAPGIQLGFADATDSVGGYPFYPTMTITSASGASGKVGIGTTAPASGYKLDVQGKIQANAFDVGDITFRSQETQQILWRMFEDEEGLYLENTRTGKVYRFVLEEVNKQIPL